MRKRNLETWVNLAILAVAAGLTIANVYQRVAPDHARAKQSREQLRAEAAQLSGKEFSMPAGYKGGATATIVLLLSKDCSSCAAGAPFYRRLSSIRSSAPADFSIAAFFPPQQGPNAGAEYLAKNAVAVDAAQSMDFVRLGLRVTPTLVLLDREHRVNRVWVGALSPDDENQVLTSLKELCKKCVVL
jgi:hypothetical protein